MNREALLKILAEEPPRETTPVWRVVIAFIIRDFKIWWTYKMWWTLEIFGIIFFISTYYLVSLIASDQMIYNAGYTTGGYLTFAAIGIAFQHYVFSSIQGIIISIRDEQWMGTLETILSSTTSFRVFLLGESLFYFIIASLTLIGSLITGVLLGVQLQTSLLSSLSVAVLSVLLVASHLCIGILNAGIILKTKQGTPIAWAFSWMTQLVSGVFYPLGLLPPYLIWIGELFPLTYSLDGIRLCLQGGETLASLPVLMDVLSLIGFILISLPFSLYIFKLGYNAARKDGSLGQY